MGLVVLEGAVLEGVVLEGALREGVELGRVVLEGVEVLEGLDGLEVREGLETLERILPPDRRASAGLVTNVEQSRAISASFAQVLAHLPENKFI